MANHYSLSSEPGKVSQVVTPKATCHFSPLAHWRRGPVLMTLHCWSVVHCCRNVAEDLVIRGLGLNSSYCGLGLQLKTLTPSQTLLISSCNTYVVQCTSVPQRLPSVCITAPPAAAHEVVCHESYPTAMHSPNIHSSQRMKSPASCCRPC